MEEKHENLESVFYSPAPQRVNLPFHAVRDVAVKHLATLFSCHSSLGHGYFPATCAPAQD